MSRYYAQPYDDGDVLDETPSNRPITRRYSTDEQIRLSRAKARRTTTSDFPPVADAYYEMESATQSVSHTAPTQKITRREEDWTRLYDSRPPVPQRQTRTGERTRRPIQPVRQPQPERRQKPLRRIEEPQREPRTNPVISRRGLFRRAMSDGLLASGIGTATLLVGAFAYAKVRSEIVTRILDEWNRGKLGRNCVSLVCGHNHDSNARPTLFYAFLGNGQLHTLEIPACDASKQVGMEAEVQVNGKPVEASVLDAGLVTVEAQRTLSGKYRIVCHIVFGDVEFSGNRDQKDVVLYDIDGKFQPQSKGGK